MGSLEVWGQHERAPDLQPAEQAPLTGPALADVPKMSDLKFLGSAARFVDVVGME